MQSERLLSLVYDELRVLAANHLRQERADHTLSPTAVVHEAYMRIMDYDRIDWNGKNHFFALAAKTLRRVLVDHARTHGRKKRGGGAKRVSLADGDRALPAKEQAYDILDLHSALDELGKKSPRQRDVVELRFFAGLSVKDTAVVLGVAEDTVKWDWRMARAWLLRSLEQSENSRS